MERPDLATSSVRGMPPLETAAAGRIRRGGSLQRGLAIAAFGVLTAAQAQVFTYSGGPGGITILGYTGADETVVIPETLNGWPVTGIGEYAFNGCATAKSVTIPSSVTYIESAPFIACSNLTSITVDPNNPTFSSLDRMAA